MIQYEDEHIDGEMHDGKMWSNISNNLFFTFIQRIDEGTAIDTIQLKSRMDGLI